MQFNPGLSLLIDVLQFKEMQKTMPLGYWYKMLYYIY